MVCKNCGANIPNGELFCPNCGTRTENAKFCKYCGAVIDLPHLTLDSVRKLIRAAVSREPAASPGSPTEECSRWETLSLRCGSTPGNPCMFRADLIPELMSLTGDQGGRKVLKRYACKYVDILDERELEDVDEMLQVTENLGEK